MFRSARIKLTVWYLCIIMLISMLFSVAIYTTITRELERGFRRVETRFREEGAGAPTPWQLSRRFEEMGSQWIEELETAKKRVALNLVVVNGIIFVFSAAAGYLLAGKTLTPIETAMEEQKRFVGDASHELRTPLTALKTTIEVALREKKLTAEDAKKVLKSSLEDLDGLESLANNLLSLTQYGQASNGLVFQPANIDDVVRSAYKKISPLAKKKSIGITVERINQEVEADKQSLEKMILIFLDNAVKYTPKDGNVTVSTKSEGKNLIMKVTDTGIGISHEEIPHIFDRFYRVDQSRSKENVPGFGLGLSLAKKIIEAHKGSVGVTSILGEGTTFTIRLPLRHI